MNIRQAIILAGGLGTRLREALPELPKCMAPIGDKPFLFYLITYLQRQGITSFIFSLGYKHEVIERYLQENFALIDYQCVIENEPLGTGGAIRLAGVQATDEHILIVNGDTLFLADLRQASEFHFKKKSCCTLILKPMENFDRYGVVETDANQRITHFREKSFYPKGNINGGIYLLHLGDFLSIEYPKVFSFEKEYLEEKYQKNAMFAEVQDAYFIDIGIPKDFRKAQRELTSILSE